jgi:4-hydroxy-tetrahydrodipicolinate reductase
MSTLAIVGISGVMGSRVYEKAQTQSWVSKIIGITLTPQASHEYETLEACPEKIDVIIDFSVPAQLPHTLQYASQHHIPCVIATTGLNSTHEQLINEASKECVVFVSANLSLGVALLNELLKTSLKFLNQDVEIEVIDIHHSLKKDAPSGTAKLLAKTIIEATGKEMTTDSASERPKDPNTFGVHSLRLGQVVGEHTISIAFGSEIITLTHSAQSKDIFAHGACSIAQSLLDLEYGYYTMNDLIKEKL